MSSAKPAKSVLSVVIVSIVAGFVIAAVTYTVSWSSASTQCVTQKDGSYPEGMVGIQNRGWPSGYITSEQYSGCQGLVLYQPVQKTYPSRYVIDVVFWSFVSLPIVFIGAKKLRKKK